MVRRLSPGWLDRIRHLPFSDGNWSYSRSTWESAPTQGWKLHLSATVLSAVDVFCRAEPILQRNDALFKVPNRLEILRGLNAGLVEFSQIGKFLTVYPRSTDQALKLARELHRATRGLPGPRIPFDVRYRKDSVVYYRYGAFRSSPDGSPGFIRAPNGRRYRDRRTPGRAVPTWLQDPFQESRANNSKKWRGLITRELLVCSAKAQRGKGGVYEAVDLSVLPVRPVIIKEGRRHGETNWDGRDGYRLIKHEAQVLRKLRKARLPVPESVREFTHDGNRYLVLEKISGRPLLPERREQPLKLSWQRADRLLESLEPILARLHTAGWVWRDCKPSHIYSHKGVLRFIDFEGACRVDQAGLLPWGSPDYLPPIYRESLTLRKSGLLEDNYALGVIAFQFGTGHFPPADNRRRAQFYKRAACPDPLRERIEGLLQL